MNTEFALEQIDSNLDDINARLEAMERGFDGHSQALLQAMNRQADALERIAFAMERITGPLAELSGAELSLGRIADYLGSVIVGDMAVSTRDKTL